MNSGLSDSRVLSGSIIVEPSLLSKKGQAWELSWRKDIRGFGKKGNEVGERLKVASTHTPCGVPEGEFLNESKFRGMHQG